MERSAEYDPIARRYEEINEGRPLYEFAVYPSFYEAVGDVAGKDCLDLGCGYGIVAENMKERGASRVVGIDKSKNNILLAKGREAKHRRGIEYAQGTVGSLGKIGAFDVATGAFLLHYAQTRRILDAMCADIRANLKPGGMFIGINNNPLHPLSRNRKYKNDIRADFPLREGSPLHVSYAVDGVRVAFDNYFWRKETYETALRKAGFADIEWLPIMPTKEGRQRMGDVWWEDFLKEPFFTILRVLV